MGFWSHYVYKVDESDFFFFFAHMLMYILVTFTQPLCHKCRKVQSLHCVLFCN